MKRLTFTDEELERIDTDCPVKNDYHTDRFCDNVCDEFQHNCPFMKMAQKLKAYEDKEEQGLLLELPVRIGKVVYFVECGEVVADFLYSVSKDKSGLWAINQYGGIIGRFGHTVFATRSEAEEALEKMGGK